MLSLIVLDNARLAQAYIDYMACQGIDVKMAAEGEGHVCLWLIDEHRYHQARNELDLFLADPTHSRYAQASWQRSELHGLQNIRFHYRSTSFGKMLTAKAGVLTLAVMLLCAVLFIFKLLGYGQDVFNWVHFPAINTQTWQVWRWFTPALFHFSVLHIVFNLLWWWQLGGDVEKRLGSGKLLLIFLSSAAGSGIAQYWVDGPNFGGLSGVVYALVGYLWILGWKRPELGLSISRPILGFMLVWLMIGYVQPIMAIANTAHLAGLICGVGLAVIDLQLIRRR